MIKIIEKQRSTGHRNISTTKNYAICRQPGSSENDIQYLVDNLNTTAAYLTQELFKWNPSVGLLVNTNGGWLQVIMWLCTWHTSSWAAVRQNGHVTANRNSMTGLNTAFQVQNLSKQNQWPVIHFLGVQGYKPVEIHGRMHAVCGNACVSKKLMLEWQWKLHSEWQEMSDEAWRMSS